MPSDNRLLVPFAATTLLLGALLLWARTYSQSCIALASPGFIYVAVFWGLLQYRLERRRFAIDYYLDGGSPWRRRLRRSWLPGAVSLVAAVPLTALLAGFVVLARATDWLFLAGAAVLAPVLFNRLSVWPGRHLRGAAGRGALAGPAVVLTSRLAGHLFVALVVIGYAYGNYSVFDAPPIYLDPELTVKAFALQASSACPAVQTGLGAAASLEGLAWWLMATVDSGQMVPEETMIFAWAAFFVSAALAMTGFVRGLEGAVLAATRMAPGGKASRARDGLNAANSGRWAVMARGAAVLAVPLVVLTAIGYHAFQQQEKERLAAQFRSVDMAETRRAINERVEPAFAPVYAAIPGLVDRYYSPAMLLDAASPLFGEDQTLFAELRRMVNGASQRAAAGFGAELLGEGVAQIGRVFSRSVEELPPWQRGPYEWVVAPVFERAKSQLDDAAAGREEDILSEVERGAESVDFATRASSFWRWVVGSDRDKEVLREALSDIVNRYKERTRAELTREVEAFKCTLLGGVAPARLRPESRQAAAARAVAPKRGNAALCGHDGGAAAQGRVAPLVESVKVSGLEPLSCSFDMCNSSFPAQNTPAGHRVTVQWGGH